MKKYLTKKNLAYLNIALGVVALIGLILIVTIQSGSVESFSDLSSITGKIGLLYFFYMLTFVLALVSIGVAVYFYFGKKEKSKVLLINMVLVGVVLFCWLFAFSGVTLLNDAKEALSGNFGSILKYANLSSEDVVFRLDTMKVWLVIQYFVAIVYGGYELYRFRKNKGEDTGIDDLQLNIDPETVQKAQETAKQALESGKENVMAFSEKAKAFYKTPKGKKIVIVIVTVAVVLIAYLVYVNLIRKTAIDLTNGCKIVVEGESGSAHGYVTGCDIEYNRENQRLNQFVSSVRYEAQDKKDGYKNGDKAVFKAIYNEEEAKALKLNITEDTIETKVKGLTEYYASAEELPNKVKKTIQEQMDEELEGFMEDVTYGDKRTSLSDDRDIVVDSHELLGMTVEKENDKISVQGIYKLTVSGEKQTSFFNEEYEPLTQVMYVMYTTNTVSSKYLDDMPDVSLVGYDTFDQDDDRYADMKIEKVAKKLGYFSGRIEVLK